MTFRTRLLLAEAPLALALALVGLVAVLTVGQLGRAGEEVLANNYRSVLAAQRMKEALERIDYWLGGLVAAALTAYLVYALLRPERF